VPVESLKPEFFEYVLRGKGQIDEVAKETGIDYGVIKRCRESFTYWYKDTSRHSASDLIFNHLTMYIFNHVAVFDKEYWPKQIVTNALVNYEGEKMSKSLGNIIPLMDGIKKHGADPLKVLEVAGTDLFTDSEFNTEALEGVKARLQYLYDVVERSRDLDAGELSRIDYWLYSKMNRKVEVATAAMDRLELRDAGIAVLFNSVAELKRYFVRGGHNGMAVKDYMERVALMLQPITPHFSEELWHLLGNATFSSVEKWPEADKGMMNDAIEAGEELVVKVVDDSRQVMALMQRKSGGKKPKEIRLMVADDWKRKLINELAKEKSIEKVMHKIGREKDIDKEAASKFVGALAKRVNQLIEVTLTQQDEFDSLSGASDYIGKQLGCVAVVEKESESKSERASRAMPGKPSLDIVFE
jgi:leucyl-tRNA synthetase